MLRVAGLTRCFDELARPALAGLDLEVAAGELVVIDGPSGAGKSLLLRLIAGLDEPTAGRIELAGKDVTGLTPAQRDVAIVGSGGSLYPHLTVYENLAFALRTRGLAEPDIAEQVDATAHGLGVYELLGRRPRQLSGGERQRVALGRAIARRPAVLLLDEPLWNLDPAARTLARRALLRAHTGSGATTLYVSHDRDDAAALADRIVTLDRGVVARSERVTRAASGSAPSRALACS